jgi:Xaa-Pro aminopeptidase
MNKKLPKASSRRSVGSRIEISARAVGVGLPTKGYRIDLMRKLMERERLDALAFTTPDYFKFATNFSADVSGFERPGLCVVPRDGRPFVVLHELSTNNWLFGQATRRIWIEDASFYSEHPRTSNRLPLATQWNELVAERLDAAGLHRARIGTDGSSLGGVRAILGGVQIESVERQCRRLRWVKHPEELEVMRVAAKLADWTQERYRENIRPGRLLAELDASMASLMAEEAAKRIPGTDLAIYCWTLSGPASAAPHGAGSPFSNLAGARINAGDMLVNCVYPAIDGLFVENERTWVCGKPTQRQTLLYEAARDANAAACDAAIAGNPIWAIDAAAQSVFEKAGVADLICHRTGHGLGLGGHDYPVDMAFNCSALLEGMVFSVEPGIYELGLGGARIDDTVIVGKKPTLLTHSPRDLPSQTILA